MPDSAEVLPWGTQWDLASAADEGVDWSAFLVTLGLQDGRAGGTGEQVLRDVPGGSRRSARASGRSA